MDDELLSALLDGELSAAEREAVEAHVATDVDARRALDELAEVRALVRALPEPVAPAGFLDALIETTVAPADGDADRVGVVALADRRRRRWPWTLAGAAAAAAVLLAVVVPGPHRAHPSLATDVRVHQAGAAATGDPVSGLAPLAAPMGLHR